MNDYNLVAVLRKRWVTIVATTFLVVASVALGTIAETPRFEATTKLFFAVPGGESISDLAQGSSFTEKQMSSYAQVATSPLVLDRVFEEVGLDTTGQLTTAVRAAVPTNTVILEISASSPNREEVAAIANAVGHRLIEVVATLYPPRGDDTQAVLATTLSRAEPPDAPATPNLKRNLGLALLLGAGIGLGVAITRERMETRIRSETDLKSVTSRTVLGEVSLDEEHAAHPFAMVDRPNSAHAEAVRRIRTNLQFVDVAKGVRSMLITSSIPSEGKTTTAVNLAIALADAGSRVLLMDADLRRPSIHRVLGLEGGSGLTSVLIGKAEIGDVTQPWQGGRFDVVAAGPIPPNPSELLGSPIMAETITALTAVYDVVLIDSPPLLPVTDAAVLGAKVDGTIVVVGADRAHRPQLRSALATLDDVGAKILGIVLNKTENRDRGGASKYGYAYTDRSKGAIPTGLESRAGRRRIRAHSLAD